MSNLWIGSFWKHIWPFVFLFSWKTCRIGGRIVVVFVNFLKQSPFVVVATTWQLLWL